jgi:hypothetical protein
MLDVVIYLSSKMSQRCQPSGVDESLELVLALDAISAPRFPSDNVFLARFNHLVVAKR